MPNVLVEYKGANVYKAAGLRFLPGVNSVDQAAWEKAKAELPLVRHRVKDGQLAELATPAPAEPAAGGAEAPAANDKGGFAKLDGFNAKEATELVGKTFDPALLAFWQETEGRKGVLAAIEGQLAKIDPANKDDDKEKGKGGAA